MVMYPNHAPGHQNLMYLEIQAHKPKDLSVAPRTATLDTTEVDLPMYFAIIDQWEETISHVWAKFDSITSSILKSVITIGQQVSELTGAIPGRNSSAYAAKVDEALVYQDSPRRSMTFKLNLAAKVDPYNEVYIPVKKLQYYSCARMGAGIVSIEWPYLFNVKIKGYDGPSLMEMKLAAMQNCDVVWKMPFVKDKAGELLPCVAELTLTFIELAPLYKQTLEQQFG